MNIFLPDTRDTHAPSHGGGACDAVRVSQPASASRTRPSARPGTAAGVDGKDVTLTLITGGDSFLMRQAALRVRDNLARAHPQSEVLSVDCADPSAGAAIMEALSPSLFWPTSVLVLWAVEEASEAAIGALVAMLGDPRGNRVVAVHSEAKSRKSLERLAGLSIPGGIAHIECRTPKRGRETRDFLTDLASQSGRQVTGDAAEALATAVGNDIALLVGALQQVLVDFPDDPITSSDVATMFSGVAEVTGFGFADAVWGRDPTAALAQFRWGEQTNTLSLPAATGAAAAGLRAMVRVRSAPRGMADAEVARLVGIPPFKVRVLRQQSASWTDQDLAAALVQLARTDAAVKGGLLPGQNLDSAQKAHALESWVRGTGEVSPAEGGTGGRRSRPGRSP